jgi:hypothetical protein
MQRALSGYPSSVTGKTRNPFASGKLFGVRQMIAPPVVHDLPTTLRWRRGSTSREIHRCEISTRIAYFAGPMVKGDLGLPMWP